MLETSTLQFPSAMQVVFIDVRFPGIMKPKLHVKFRTAPIRMLGFNDTAFSTDGIIAQLPENNKK